MRSERAALSVSGLQSELIAIGGWNLESLNICEKYTMKSNKWVELAPLNRAR